MKIMSVGRHTSGKSSTHASSRSSQSTPRRTATLTAISPRGLSKNSTSGKSSASAGFSASEKRNAIKVLGASTKTSIVARKELKTLPKTSNSVGSKSNSLDGGGSESASV